MKKLDKILYIIYIELYANATPSADFKKLLSNAKINEFGQKEIDFMAYEIEGDLMDEIIAKHTNKLKPYEKKMIIFDVYLGASPKTKIK